MSSPFTIKTLRFLRALKRNNDREWFRARKTKYETDVRQPMLELLERLAVDFRAFAPEFVAEPPPASGRSNSEGSDFRDLAMGLTEAVYLNHQGRFATHTNARPQLDASDRMIQPCPRRLPARRWHFCAR